MSELKTTSLNQKQLALWLERPETAEIVVRAQNAMSPKQLDMTIKLWDVLHTLSADPDMLLASAVYICPDMKSADFQLKPEAPK